MRLAFFRLSELTKFSIIITGVLVMLYSYGPNLQADAYKKTAPIEYDESRRNDYDLVGYPAAQGYPEVKSVEDIKQLQYFDTLTITIDVKNLQATHVYSYILEAGGTFKSTLWRMFVNNTSDGGVGQFYILTLESGEKIIIYLDDTALDLPKTGLVTLPIGAYINKGSERPELREIQEKYQITGDATTFYINMSGLWRKSEEAMAVDEIRTDRCFYSSMFLIALQVVIHIIAGRMKKATGKE